MELFRNRGGTARKYNGDFDVNPEIDLQSNICGMEKVYCCAELQQVQSIFENTSSQQYMQITRGDKPWDGTFPTPYGKQPIPIPKRNV